MGPSMLVRHLDCFARSRVVLLLIGLSGAVGCGGNPFVPPPPPELAESTSAVGDSSPSAIEIKEAGEEPPSRTTGGRVVELILDRPPSADQVFLAQILRQRTGKAQTAFRSFAPEADEPRSVEWTVKTIQTAVELGAKGLLVEVDPAPAVLQALEQARAKGVAVLSLETPLPTASGKPFPVVTYGSFVDAGRRIVKTLLDAALKIPDFPSTRILIIDNRNAGPFREARLESLTAPLKDFGRKWDVVWFDGTETDGQRALNKALTTPGPRVSVVIAQEDLGFFLAHRALLSRIEQNQPEFLLGGYFSYDTRGGPDVLKKALVFGDRAVGRFAAKAFESLALAIDGKPVPDRIEVPIEVHATSMFFVPVPAPKTPPAKP